MVNNYGVDGRGEHGGNTGPADSVVAEIRATGGQTMAACCDIGDRAQAEQMVDAVIAQWGRIDMLIHNASTYADLGPFESTRVADLERIMRGFVARVFVGGTAGASFTLETMSPESLLEALPRILDESGARLSAGIAAVNPEFAEALAAAKRDRAVGR